jgi:hypothetical protein
MEGSYDYKQAKNDVGLFMGMRQALVFLMEGFHYSFFTQHMRIQGVVFLPFLRYYSCQKSHFSLIAFSVLS